MDPSLDLAPLDRFDLTTLELGNATRNFVPPLLWPLDRALFKAVAEGDHQRSSFCFGQRERQTENVLGHCGHNAIIAVRWPLAKASGAALFQRGERRIPLGDR